MGSICNAVVVVSYFEYLPADVSGERITFCLCESIRM